MTEPIALSLTGEGRVVMLRPTTVRRAYFEFVQVNDLMARQVYRLNPRRSKRRRLPTALDRLYRRHADQGDRRSRHGLRVRYDDDLTPAEVEWIERVMNQMLLDEGAALVHGESRLQVGTVVHGRFQQRTKRIQYVIRYGMFFEVEPLKRQTLLQGSVRDVIIEGHDRSISILRYAGLKKDASGTRMELRFCQRFDFRRTLSVPLVDFRPRRLFSICRVEACEGFAIRERVALADARFA